MANSYLSKLAQSHFATYAPDHKVMADMLGLPAADTIGIDSSDSITQRVYDRVKSKLEMEAVEDHRVDFEDGYGNRSNEEEDATAVTAAKEVAKGMADKTLSPFIGIRIKPFTEDLKERGTRTLDIFVSTLSAETNGKLPENFVVLA